MTGKLILLSSLLALAACNSNTSIQTKAHIFERRLLNNGKLMVCYAYNTGKTIIRDTSIIENKILPADSVVIVFKKNNPAHSSLLR